jgi:hypothetical protein
MSDIEVESLLARRRRTLGDPTPLFYDEPLHIVRGHGVWLFDHQDDVTWMLTTMCRMSGIVIRRSSRRCTDRRRG